MLNSGRSQNRKLGPRDQRFKRVIFRLPLRELSVLARAPTRGHSNAMEALRRQGRGGRHGPRRGRADRTSDPVQQKSTHRSWCGESVEAQAFGPLRPRHQEGGSLRPVGGNGAVQHHRDDGEVVTFDELVVRHGLVKSTISSTLPLELKRYSPPAIPLVTR